MYLQGNLQVVFDALYHMGIIDPVLEMDWSKAMEELPQHYNDYLEVVRIANTYQDDPEKLVRALEIFNDTALGYLAMEVAREFADFHARENVH